MQTDQSHVVHLLFTVEEELMFGQQVNMSVIKTPEKIRYAPIFRTKM